MRLAVRQSCWWLRGSGEMRPVWRSCVEMTLQWKPGGGDAGGCLRRDGYGVAEGTGQRKSSHKRKGRAAEGGRSGCWREARVHRNGKVEGSARGAAEEL